MNFGQFLMEPVDSGSDRRRPPQCRYASTELSSSSSSTEPEDLGIRFPVRPASKLLSCSENVSMSLHSLSSARSDSPTSSACHSLMATPHEMTIDRPVSLNVPMGSASRYSRTTAAAPNLEVRSASAPDRNFLVDESVAQQQTITNQPRKESLISAQSAGQQSGAELVQLDPLGDNYVVPSSNGRQPKLRSATVHPYNEAVREANSMALSTVTDLCNCGGIANKMRNFCYQHH